MVGKARKLIFCTLGLFTLGWSDAYHAAAAVASDGGSRKELSRNGREGEVRKNRVSSFSYSSFSSSSSSSVAKAKRKARPQREKRKRKGRV
jgi:hypothetical protein